MPAELRIELFVEDLDVFADFYADVLRFSVLEDRRASTSPYLFIARDSVRVGAVVTPGASVRHASTRQPATELVLVVDDIVDEFRRVVTTGWTLASDLCDQPWGLTDFRLHDPDGYYWRISSRSSRRE